MVTTLERLLLVCAVRFVAFERLSSIRRYPICVLLMILMLEVQSINSACMDFLESVPGANGRWNPTVRSWCGHGFLTQPELASQSAGTLEKLLGNRFCHDGKTRTEKNGKIRTERYEIPNFRRFRKSLATSRKEYRNKRRRMSYL